MILTATVPSSSSTGGGDGGFTPHATSYGRASWPMTTVFSSVAEGSLPVIPWYANLSATDPWTPPAYAKTDTGLLVAVAERMGRQYE